MKMILAALVVVASLALPTTSTAQPKAVPATTSTHDVSATISGEHKCLGPGEYCKSREAHQYLHYGFECVGSPARLRRRR